MMDYSREDVIEALEYLISPVCTETQFDYCDEIRAAIAWLKEKEPKMLTLEEVEKNEDWMWVEYVSGYCGWQRPDKEDDYLNMVAWNDATFDRKDYYGKTWRCWTARPTEEQRKAVKWE